MIIGVIGQGIIEHRKSYIHFGMPVFDDFQVTGMGVLVSGIVRDINLFSMVMRRIPVVKKSDALVVRYRIEKIRYLRVTIDMHIRGKQGMIEGIIGIVLAGIVFANQAVGYQI